MMKKNVLITMLFVSSSFSMTLVAQENLDALIKKCEAMPTIDINVARVRKAQTKEIEYETITLTIRDNPALVNDFATVFKKDEANAIQTTERREGGHIKTLYYRLENATYLISCTDEKTARITITRGVGKSPEGIISDLNGLPYTTFGFEPIQGTMLRYGSKLRTVVLRDSLLRQLLQNK